MRKLHSVSAAVAFCLLPNAAPALDLARLQAICVATAREAPTVLARTVAAGAKREHALFGGHVIDARGRLVRVGSHESATALRSRAAPNEVPWRNVLRYWETLSGRRAADGQAAGAQTVYFAPGMLSAPAAEELATRSVELQALLAAIAGADFSHTGDAAGTREALLASAIRASMADVPWSAAFVSAVLRDAGVPAQNFAFSAAHMEYIAQAVRSSAAESSSGSGGEALYRACDPYRVAPRAGDLVCYHRHDPDEAPDAGRGLFGSLAPAIAAGQAQIWRSHCDVVTEVDAAARKVRTVGGNVQQSVALRSLNLNARMTLSPNQGGAPCADAPREGDAAPRPCSLNAQPWFVLLQMRDG